jgi:serine protease AprX
MKSLVYVFIFLFGLKISAQNIVAKVNNRAMQLAIEKGKSDCIISFTNTNTNFINKTLNKIEKATQVYNTLSKATSNQKNIIDYLKSKNIPFKSYWIVNAIQAKLSPQQMLDIAAFAEVQFIHYNEPIPHVNFKKGNSISTNSVGAVTWGIDTIQADVVWNMGINGQNVIIGGQDTGYDFMHPAINDKYKGKNTDGTYNHNYNWHDAIHERHPLNDPLQMNPCGFNTIMPCDDGSHGTHTMGTMVGSVDDTNTAIGVAPNAKWIACRNMDEGWGLPSTYIECWEFFVAPTDLNNQNPDFTKSPHVVNNSWGCPPSEGCDNSNFELMRQVYENVRNAGIVIVQSAGNDGNQGCSTIMNPGSMYDEAFSIGSTDPNDTISSFSSKGPSTFTGHTKPNVSAPGANVRSSVPGGGFANYWGTSMAGPHVAGIVALIISANPSLAGNVDEIEHIIEQTAKRMTDNSQCGGTNNGLLIPNNIYGWGRVNAKAAVDLAIQLLNVDNENPIFHNQIKILNAETIQIEITNYSNPFTIEVFNTEGKVIALWNIQSNFSTFDISTFSKGVYFLHNNTYRFSRNKFIKI